MTLMYSILSMNSILMLKVINIVITKFNINYDDQVSVKTYRSYLMTVWEEPNVLWFTCINKQITAKERFNILYNVSR